MKSRGRQTVLQVRFPQLDQAAVEVDRGVKRYDLSKNWESSTTSWTTSFLSAGKRSPHYSNFFKTSDDIHRRRRLFTRHLAQTTSLNPPRPAKSQLNHYRESILRSVTSGKSEAELKTKASELQPTKQRSGKNMHRMIEIMDNHKLNSRFEHRHLDRVAPHT
jgi:hypothetical protein